jgi:hypothetical protein
MPEIEKVKEIGILPGNFIIHNDLFITRLSYNYE